MKILATCGLFQAISKWFTVETCTRYAGNRLQFLSNFSAMQTSLMPEHVLFRENIHDFFKTIVKPVSSSSCEVRGLHKAVCFS